MLLKSLFDTKPVDEFARSLARDFVQRFPPELGREAKKGADQKLALAITHLHQQAQQFHLTHKIGLYKKAKLSNTFKWELKEMGYKDELIDVLIKGMLVVMTGKKKA